MFSNNVPKRRYIDEEEKWTEDTAWGTLYFKSLGWSEYC